MPAHPATFRDSSKEGVRAAIYHLRRYADRLRASGAADAADAVEDAITDLKNHL